MTAEKAVFIYDKNMRNRINGQFSEDFRVKFIKAFGVAMALMWVVVAFQWADSRIRSALTTTFTVERAQAQAFIGPVDWRIEVRQIWKAYKLDVKRMENIVKCESTWRPDAVHYNKNGTADYGLYQLNSIHNYPMEKMLDPIQATYLAIQVLEKQGYEAWVCD